MDLALADWVRGKHTQFLTRRHVGYMYECSVYIQNVMNCRGLVSSLKLVAASGLLMLSFGKVVRLSF